MASVILLGLLVSHLAAPATIAFGAIIGLLLPKWGWVLAAAVAVALVWNAALYLLAAMIGTEAPTTAPLQNPDLFALDLGASVIALVIWATIFFAVRQIGLQAFRAVRPQP